MINQIPEEYKVGGLYVFSDPPGADIYLDYTPIKDKEGNIAKTPIILTDIPPGHHTITFKMIGFRIDTVTTEVIGGYYASVYGVLLPFPVPVPPT